jgi:hypothetical protein
MIIMGGGVMFSDRNMDLSYFYGSSRDNVAYFRLDTEGGTVRPKYNPVQATSTVLRSCKLLTTGSFSTKKEPYVRYMYLPIR